MDVKIKKKDANLEDLTKDALIARIKALEAHNQQLKNIISKANTRESVNNDKANKKFDSSKYHFRHILLKFLYLGWDYKGYTVQEDTIDTIEHHLFKALCRTCLIKDRQSSNYHRCGRTDKGVSSYGQCISLNIRSKLTKETEHNLEEEMDYCSILNKVLPDDIQCIAWSPVHEEYSARFDCQSRTYKYFFPRGQLDINKLETSAQMLVGSHDYRNFCKMDVGNGVVQFTRRIDSITVQPANSNEIINEHTMYVATIKGKAFLWHQIRCIMAVLLLIGQNKEQPGVIQELLDVKNNPRKPEYHMASEIPLNLYHCDYPDVKWHSSQDSIQVVKEKLQQAWCFNSIKTTMIESMISDLNPTNNLKCLSESLIPNFRQKTYTPLLKRQKCDTLEEKIAHFAKRKRIELVDKTE